MCERQIQSILKKSRDYNNKCGITGLLIYHGGMFVQWLEGLRQDVETLERKLRNDARHDDFFVIEAGPIGMRFFPRWHMAYLNTLDTTQKTQAYLTHKEATDLAASHGKPWLAMDALLSYAERARVAYSVFIESTG